MSFPPLGLHISLFILLYFLYQRFFDSLLLIFEQLKMFYNRISFFFKKYSRFLIFILISFLSLWTVPNGLGPMNIAVNVWIP